MFRIHKHIIGDGKVKLPVDAKILSIQMQNGFITAWYETCNPNIVEFKEFKVIGTGWDIEDFKRKYIATVKDGLFVWHIYEVLEK